MMHGLDSLKLSKKFHGPPRHAQASETIMLFIIISTLDDVVCFQKIIHYTINKVGRICHLKSH